jgi:hypothetical protein
VDLGLLFAKRWMLVVELGFIAIAQALLSGDCNFMKKNNGNIFFADSGRANCDLSNAPIFNS